MTAPRRLPLLAALLAAALWLTASVAAAQTTPAQPFLYVSQPAAAAIAAGTNTIPGFPDSVRQGPARPEDWPARQVAGKLSGPALAGMSADGMAAAFTAALRQTPAGVGVDELLPTNWTVAANRNLKAALERIGPDAAARVFLFISPAFVSRIGTTDPSRPLSSQNASLVAALRAGGTAVLELYRPGSGHLRELEYAYYPARWLPRFPGAAANRLRIMYGPDGGLGQGQLWRWTRATPAGRRILGNGPAAYGLRTEAEGRDWLLAYADYLASPSSSPTGRDVVVPALGGFDVSQAGPRRLRLTSTLAYRIVIQLLPAGGGPRRVIGPYFGPTPRTGRLITLPPGVRGGRYTALAVGFGERMREEARAQVDFGPSPRQ